MAAVLVRPLDLRGLSDRGSAPDRGQPALLGAGERQDDHPRRARDDGDGPGRARHGVGCRCGPVPTRIATTGSAPRVRRPLRRSPGVRNLRLRLARPEASRSLHRGVCRRRSTSGRHRRRDDAPLPGLGPVPDGDVGSAHGIRDHVARRRARPPARRFRSRCPGASRAGLHCDRRRRRNDRCRGSRGCGDRRVLPRRHAPQPWRRPVARAPSGVAAPAPFRDREAARRRCRSMATRRLPAARSPAGASVAHRSERTNGRAASRAVDPPRARVPRGADSRRSGVAS